MGNRPFSAHGPALAVLLSLIPAASFAAGPFTGSVVAAAGDVNGDGYGDLIVGTPNTAGGGLVSIYLGSADGTLTLQRQLVSGESGSRFGAAVACAGDVNGDGYDDIVIGQPQHAHSPVLLGVGQVWIFLGGPGGIGTTPQIQIEGTDANGHFGAAVSTAGDMNGDGYDEVVVGAPQSNGGGAPGSLQGRASIYSGSASGLTLSAFVQNGNANNQLLGTSVAGGCDINGDGFDDVIIGAPSTGSTTAEVLLVRGSSLGATFNFSDLFSGPVESLGFGTSVAEVGDCTGDGYADVVVGAPLTSAGALIDNGKAYLMTGSQGGLSLPAGITTGTENNELLGQWVGCAGDRNGDGVADIAVGAPNATGPLGANQGMVWIRYGTLTTLPTPYVTATLFGPAAGSQFGTCVSGAGELSGNGFADLAVGSPGVGVGGQVNLFSGGVFASARSSGTAYTAAIVDTGFVQDRFGTAVAEGGDLNGDGFGDVLVGAPSDSDTVTSEGVVQTFLGFRGNTRSIVNYDHRVHGGQTGSQFGAAVDFAGDVDGDGYDDVVVGAPGDAHAFPGGGRAYLFRGGPAGLDTVATWSVDGDAPAAALGSSVCGAGDLNRDGYADFAVGEPGANGGAGKVSIYYGSPVGPTASAAQVLSSATPGDSLGARLAPAGDVNGDGYDDLLIGAPGHNGSQGQVMVLYGGPHAPGASSILSTTLGPGARFGAGLAGRGDIDLDGLADVAIGAPGANGNAPGSGIVEIHRGSNGGLTAAAAQVLAGFNSGDRFGAAVSFGDFNADGRSDLAVGAPGLDQNTPLGFVTDAGGVYLCASDASGNLVLPDTTVLVRPHDMTAGSAVSLAGDINGDGFADLVEGEPFGLANASQSGEPIGIVLMYLGGGTRQTWERLPRQRTSNSAGPLALEGGVKASDGFTLAMRARTPAGRQRVTVEWQAGPVASPFSALPTHTLIPRLTDQPDTLGSKLDVMWNVTGIPAGTPVHWRSRVRSHAPWFAYTPWLTPAGNASTLADLDVIPSPVGAGRLDPTRLALAAPMPNPARGSVALEFGLPQAGEANLAVFDPRGRLVRQLVRGRMPAGTAKATWDGTDAHGARVGAGVYFALLRMGEQTAARRIVRLP